MAHASNRGTDGSGPIQAGTILADARADDFIPLLASLHEFRERNLSSRLLNNVRLHFARITTIVAHPMPGSRRRQIERVLNLPAGIGGVISRFH
jgi:hypothetical protein